MDSNSHNVRYETGKEGGTTYNAAMRDGGRFEGVNKFSGKNPAERCEDQVKAYGMNEAAKTAWESVIRNPPGRSAPARVTAYLISQLETAGRREEAAALMPHVTYGTRPQNRLERQRAEESRAAQSLPCFATF